MDRTVPCFHVLTTDRDVLLESYLTKAEADQAAAEIAARWGEGEVRVAPGRYHASHFGL